MPSLGGTALAVGCLSESMEGALREHGVLGRVARGITIKYILYSSGGVTMAKQEIEVAGAPKQVKITPFEHHTKYHETDWQGIIHPSNYTNWMEDARMNLMEQMGLSFKQMLDMEISSPIVSQSIEYRSQVKFDETIVVDTKLISYDGHEMEVAYRIYDKATGEDRAVAKTRHCFLNKSGIPISMKRAYPELDTKFFEFK